MKLNKTNYIAANTNNKENISILDAVKMLNIVKGKTQYTSILK